MKTNAQKKIEPQNLYTYKNEKIKHKNTNWEHNILFMAYLCDGEHKKTRIYSLASFVSHVGHTVNQFTSFCVVSFCFVLPIVVADHVCWCANFCVVIFISYGWKSMKDTHRTNHHRFIHQSFGFVWAYLLI